MIVKDKHTIYGILVKFLTGKPIILINGVYF